MTTIAQACRARAAGRRAARQGEGGARGGAGLAAGRGWPIDSTSPCPTGRRGPPRPELLPPNRMPKRGKAGSERSRIAMLHALAHIEYGAIDLAFDMAGRFGAGLPARLRRRLARRSAPTRRCISPCSTGGCATLGAHYGALPAHDGLWEAAAATAHDPLARLAVVPMVLEARGLDVTPATRGGVRARRRRPLGRDPGAHLSRRDPPRRGGHALVQIGLRIPRIRRVPQWQRLIRQPFPRDR